LVDVAAIEVSPLLGRLSRLEVPSGGAPGAIAALALAGIAWSGAADGMTAPMPDLIVLPDVPGWQLANDAPAAEWRPLHTGADHRLKGRYTDGRGTPSICPSRFTRRRGMAGEAGGFGEGACRLAASGRGRHQGQPLPMPKAM